jgi:hypothetical protein
MRMAELGIDLSAFPEKPKRKALAKILEMNNVLGKHGRPLSLMGNVKAKDSKGKGKGKGKEKEKEENEKEKEKVEEPTAVGSPNTSTAEGMGTDMAETSNAQLSTAGTSAVEESTSKMEGEMALDDLLAECFPAAPKEPSKGKNTPKKPKQPPKPKPQKSALKEPKPPKEKKPPKPKVAKISKDSKIFNKWKMFADIQLVDRSNITTTVKKSLLSSLPSASSSKSISSSSLTSFNNSSAPSTSMDNVLGNLDSFSFFENPLFQTSSNLSFLDSLGPLPTASTASSSTDPNSLIITTKNNNNTPVSSESTAGSGSVDLLDELLNQITSSLPIQPQPTDPPLLNPDPSSLLNSLPAFDLSGPQAATAAEGTNPSLLSSLPAFDLSGRQAAATTTTIGANTATTDMLGPTLTLKEQAILEEAMLSLQEEAASCRNESFLNGLFDNPTTSLPLQQASSSSSLAVSCGDSLNNSVSSVSSLAGDDAMKAILDALTNELK